MLVCCPGLFSSPSSDEVNAGYITELGCRKIMLMAKNERKLFIAENNCGTPKLAYYLPQNSDEAVIPHLVKVFPPPKGNN